VNSIDTIRVIKKLISCMKNNNLSREPFLTWDPIHSYIPFFIRKKCLQANLTTITTALIGIEVKISLIHSKIRIELSRVAVWTLESYC